MPCDRVYFSTALMKPHSINIFLIDGYRQTPTTRNSTTQKVRATKDVSSSGARSRSRRCR